MRRVVLWSIKSSCEVCPVTLEYIYISTHSRKHETRRMFPWVNLPIHKLHQSAQSDYGTSKSKSHIPPVLVAQQSVMITDNLHPIITSQKIKREILINPFRTAVPFWGRITYSLTGVSPKWDCGSKRVKRHSEGSTIKAIFRAILALKNKVFPASSFQI